MTTSFLDHSDDETTQEGTLTTGDETTPSLLDDLDDEEDVDFTQETPRVHRKMKISRLITEDELPDWLKNDVDQIEKTLENDEDFGKGRRQRKDIDYSDNLTEREFLQALEEGNLDDAVEQKRIRKQNRKNLLSTQDHDIDLDETEACSSFDNPPSISQTNQQNTSSKRGSVKKRLESVDPKIAPQCRLLLDHLLAYRTDDDRQLAQVFIRLPGQKQLPLYYQIIEEPIDFQRIRRKIDTYRYSNMEQFHSDIKLLVRNAQTFNCETSIIYSDSILLGKVYENLCEQLQSGVLPLSTETTTETNEITTASTPRISSRRGRGTRATTTTTTTTTPVATNSEVSRRGRKRKTIVTKEEEDACEDERVISDDSDNQED
jgi:ATP-dependent helicase STH1/SNF2